MFQVTYPPPVENTLYLLGALSLSCPLYTCKASRCKQEIDDIRQHKKGMVRIELLAVYHAEQGASNEYGGINMKHHPCSLCVVRFNLCAFTVYTVTASAAI